jgi:hypothetical protein
VRHHDDVRLLGIAFTAVMGTVIGYAAGMLAYWHFEPLVFVCTHPVKGVEGPECLRAPSGPYAAVGIALGMASVACFWWWQTHKAEQGR